MCERGEGIGYRGEELGAMRDPDHLHLLNCYFVKKKVDFSWP